MTDDLITEQIAYYRARAPEYEDWWERRGQYDFGPEDNASWRAQMAEARAELDRRAPFGNVLELAAGTGLFTEQLARQGESVTAVDASPEALALNRQRLQHAGLIDRVAYVEADLFAWRPERQYDTLFFGFWLSHVPDDRWQAFWSVVSDALAPGGRVFLIDNAKATAAELERAGIQVDLDDDVVTFKNSSVDYKAGVAVVKRGWTAEQLTAELTKLGWAATVDVTGWAFIWAAASRPAD